MKVILNQDVPHLGEEGDVKDVARGYARNYLYPRALAVPYNDKTVKLFEARSQEIEAKKEIKRAGAATTKARLEELELKIVMPAGPNGKLYGAVTSASIVDELAKHGFDIERKRVEVPGNSVKSVGKILVNVKLYESASAEVNVVIEAEPVKETKSAERAPRERRQREEGRFYSRVSVDADVEAAAAEAEAEAAAEEAAASVEAAASLDASASVDADEE